MRSVLRAGLAALAWSFLFIGQAAAQPANIGCTSSPSAGSTQTLRCDNGITIVAESGARFEVRDANRDGHIDSVELSSKALLIEVPKKPGGNPFKVLTPRAIAACAAPNGRSMPLTGRRPSLSSMGVLAWTAPPADAPSCLERAKASTSRRLVHWWSSAGHSRALRP